MVIFHSYVKLPEATYKFHEFRSQLDLFRVKTGSVRTRGLREVIAFIFQFVCLVVAGPRDPVR